MIFDVPWTVETAKAVLRPDPHLLDVFRILLTRRVLDRGFTQDDVSKISVFWAYQPWGLIHFKNKSSQVWAPTADKITRIAQELSIDDLCMMIDLVGLPGVNHTLFGDNPLVEYQDYVHWGDYED